MLQTVIFDMDGVIVDTEPVHKYAYFKHFEELGISVSEEMYATFTGNSTRNVFQKLKTTFGLEEEVETLIQRKRFLFNDAFDTKEDLQLIKGVENLIKRLHAENIQLVLASSASKSTIQRVFNRFHLHPFFTHLVSGEDFPKSKPDPAIFIKAHELSGTAKENCIVIEDSHNGVLAAVGAGIYCIGFHSPHSKLQDLTLAQQQIHDFDILSVTTISNWMQANNK